jgi:hypothetical protein
VDTNFLTAQAERCRSLAENADEFTKRRLLDLALKQPAPGDHANSRSAAPSHSAAPSQRDAKTSLSSALQVREPDVVCDRTATLEPPRVRTAPLGRYVLWVSGEPLFTFVEPDRSQLRLVICATGDGYDAFKGRAVPHVSTRTRASGISALHVTATAVCAIQL